MFHNYSNTSLGSRFHSTAAFYIIIWIDRHNYKQSRLITYHIVQILVGENFGEFDESKLICQYFTSPNLPLKFLQSFVWVPNQWHMRLCFIQLRYSTCLLVSVLEITADHWPFSNQFQHLANQNPFRSAKFTVYFQWEDNQ